MTKPDRIKTIWDNLQIRSGAEALAAALFSLPVTVLVSWLISRCFYLSWPVYSEFSAGGTVYNGYNKQGDMCFFYALIVLLPVLFAGFLLIKHCLQDKYGPALLKSKKIPYDFAGISGLHKRREKQLESIGTVLIPIMLGTMAVPAVNEALAVFYPAHAPRLSQLCDMLTVIWLVFVLILAGLCKKRKRDLTVFRDRASAFFQLILPIAFLGYSRFYYDYEKENALIELFYSLKWRAFCYVLTLALFLWQCLRIYQKKTGISVCSCAVMAVIASAGKPAGILSVDFFHNGEMAMPMQQLLSYGKLPYFDLDPIHGFCDFFYSFFNYLFFDGSYFSQNAAVLAAQIFMAAVLGALVGYFVKNDLIKLCGCTVFMLYLTDKAGIRYFIFFAAFIILLSDKIRKNSHHFLWWWAVLSMLGIAFHVSIGASLAVAFLPEALWRFIKDVIPDFKKFMQKSTKEKRRLFLLYGSLLLLGLAYIPWFIQILRYLKENAGTTLWVNGTEIFGPELKPVETFTFLAVYLALIVLSLGKSKKGRAVFVSMAGCMAVIFHYSCVRYDEGLRLGVLGVFFGLLIFLYLYDECVLGWFQGGYHIIFFLLCAYICFTGCSFEEAYGIPAEKEVEIYGKTVSDPIVYVSGDSVGMPHLGTGFIQGLTLNSLQNVQTVLLAENAMDSYLDLTNKISHTVIFDSEVKYPFTSAYNVSNDLLQKKMLGAICKEKPRLILLAPYIRFDQAPIGLRSPKLYQALLDMGYQPYAYEDVIYLLDGESQFDSALTGERRLGELNHRTDLGMLPYLWGTAEGEKEELAEIAADIHSLNGTEVFYMEITADADTIATQSFTIDFQSDVDGETYRFMIDTGLEKLKKTDREIRYMIPLGTSPFFSYSGDVDLQIEGIDIKEIHYYR